MRTLLTLLCFLLVPFVGFSNTQYHEFEGVSEVYNIRNLKVLAKFLPEDSVIVEAGGYQGRDTVKIAERFPRARIFVFEPLTTAYPQLVAAVERYSNVIPLNQALAETTGERKFYICHGAYGQDPIFEFHSSLLKPAKGSEINLCGPIKNVPTLSLKDFCVECGIDRIDMLWLSTEGSELQVLNGAGPLLSKVSLVYVRSQLYPSREGITLFSDLRSFMESRGFVLLSHFYLKGIHGDALFVKKEKI